MKETRLLVVLIAIVEAMQTGDVVVAGNPAKLVEFLGLIDRFDPWFNVVTP